MAKYEDYLPSGKNDPTNTPAEEIADDIKAADQVQEERKDSTPEANWETKYKELEKFASQQGNIVGDYRRIIDEYIVKDSTSQSEPQEEESTPLTYDDLYSNPDEAIAKAVASHPDVKAAKQLQAQYAQDANARAEAEFKDKHPDYQEIATGSDFRSWVQENNTRLALARAADQYDLNSADALFSLYKAEKGLSQATAQQQEAEAIQAASLEDSTADMVTEPAKFSRSEFVDKKTRAMQGDLEAEKWVNRNIARYREALMNGNVRD